MAERILKPVRGPPPAPCTIEIPSEELHQSEEDLRPRAPRGAARGKPSTTDSPQEASGPRKGGSEEKADRPIKTEREETEIHMATVNFERRKHPGIALNLSADYWRVSELEIPLRLLLDLGISVVKTGEEPLWVLRRD